MSNIRFFSGGRDMGMRGVASQQMRFELQKKGKLPAGERYKRILKKKLQENKEAALGSKFKKGSMPTTVKQARQISKRTEQVLKELAARKASKEAKRERQMVIVQARTFPVGQVNRKGQLFDVAGNMVARVNLKNGKIVTETGWNVGKYKPKSYMTTLLLQDTITRFSPHFIQQRKLQMMQQMGMDPNGTAWGRMDLPETINILGASHSHHDSASEGALSSGGPRQNIGMTSWGARSDNVWGTFADNAWGNSADNVWGTNSTDVWGGIGVGSIWGKGLNLWGTGNGRNYLSSVTSAILALFGISNKENRQKLRALRQAAAAASTRTGGGGSTRSSGSTRR